MSVKSFITQGPEVVTSTQGLLGHRPYQTN
jgi:hypothetical protein